MSKFSEFNEDVNNSNISFGSTVNTSTASSKAVLAALRALQEKIRRLEAEKNQAIDECQNLRNQMKIIEIDIDHVRQREVLSSQKLIQETHIEYEKVLSEKNQLEIRLNNLEEERILLQKSSEEMTFKIKCLEEDKSTYTIKLHDFESLQTQLQTHLINVKQKEKELSQKMSTDLKEKEKNIEILNKRVKSANIELDKVKDEKASSEKRLIELDKLVRQLLATNEALVASNASFVAKDCVTGLPSSINNYKYSKNNHLRKPISLPNVVTKSTESAKAKIINKQSFEKSRAKSGKLSSKYNIENNSNYLQELHNIYVNMSKSLIDEPKSLKQKPKKNRTHKKQIKNIKAKSSENNHDNKFELHIPHISYAEKDIDDSSDGSDTENIRV